MAIVKRCYILPHLFLPSARPIWLPKTAYELPVREESAFRYRGGLVPTDMADVVSGFYRGWFLL